MKLNSIFAIIVTMLFCCSANATVVTFDLTDLGSDSFEYTYTIENDTLPESIEWLTIWFDESLYGNLSTTSPTSITDNWNEIILPSTGFEIPLGYDAQALSDGITAGQTVTGFSVTFDWLGGQGTLPGPQQFEIINPSDSQTIDSGQTIPEPTTLLLFALSGLLLRKTKH